MITAVHSVSTDLPYGSTRSSRPKIKRVRIHQATEAPTPISSSNNEDPDCSIRPLQMNEEVTQTNMITIPQVTPEIVSLPNPIELKRFVRKVLSLLLVHGLLSIGVCILAIKIYKFTDILGEKTRCYNRSIRLDDCPYFRIDQLEANKDIFSKIWRNYVYYVAASCLLCDGFLLPSRNKDSTFVYNYHTLWRFFNDYRVVFVYKKKDRIWSCSKHGVDVDTRGFSPVVWYFISRNENKLWKISSSDKYRSNLDNGYLYKPGIQVFSRERETEFLQVFIFSSYRFLRIHVVLVGIRFMCLVISL